MDRFLNEFYMLFLPIKVFYATNFVNISVDVSSCFKALRQNVHS